MKEDIINQGKNHFKNQWYCAESVLLALSDAAGIKSELIPKIATGFCAGMGRTNGFCGAVTGAILAINVLTGRSDSEDSVDLNYKMVEKIQEKFKAKYESLNCFELTKCDFTKPEGHAKFDEENMGEKCTEFVGDAIRMTLDVFKEMDIKPFSKDLTDTSILHL